MSPLRRSLLVTASMLVASCSSETAGPTPGGAFRVINATGTRLDVIVDGQTLQQGVAVASLSDAFSLDAGSHQVVLRASSGASANLTIQSVASQVLTAAAVSTSNSIAASVVADTGAIVPAGKSKLRVIHLSANAGSIEIWRTQPDFQTPVHIMTPFDYQNTSPYLQSDPGNWEVFVTRPGSTTRVASTGLVAVPAGSRRTAVLLDSAGVLRFRIVE